MSRRLHGTVLAVALGAAAPAGALLLGSCSDDEARAASDARDAAADRTTRDRAPGDEESVDAGEDASGPPIALPACVGSSIPMDVSGDRAFVNVQLGTLPDGGYATKGDFVLDFGSNRSTIDLVRGFLDAGAPPPTQCGADAAAPGVWCTFEGFEFFGDWGTVTLTTADHGVLAGSKRQAGILGTDFLVLNPFALDFRSRRIHRSAPAAFCTDAQLLASGLRPLPSQGFYATDTSKLRPLSEVLTTPDAGVESYVVPNVPTVPVTIGGVSALAQLDTGYEDRLVRRSVNVNEPLLAVLKAQNLLTRNALLDLYATTCVPGLNEKLEGYYVNDGQKLAFVGEGGTIVRRDAVHAVYLKRSKLETFECGGISTWTVPAAQVGASFYVDAQAMVVDPTTSRVWMPANTNSN